MERIERLDVLFGRASENRLIKAIRQGLLYNMPLIMVGSFVLMVLNLPIPALNHWIEGVLGQDWKTLGLAVHSATFGIMSLSTLLSVSFAIVRERDRTRKGNGNSIIATLTALACYVAFHQSVGSAFGESATGPTGIFGAIVLAVLSTNLYEFIYNHLPQQRRVYAYDADAILQSSLANVLPVFFTVTAFALARILLDFTGAAGLLAEGREALNQMLFYRGGNLVTLLLYCLSTHVMWFFGIHGTNVMENVARELFNSATDINVALSAAGQKPTQVLTKEFLDVFVFLGGAGCTLGLLIALFFAGRSSNASGLARYSVFPGLFNINEIMVYGLPIIFNPYYLAPFLLTPMALGLSSYAAFSLGLVPLTVNRVVWTTPIFLSGYSSTGSVAGIFLQLFNLMLAAAIYLPFVRLYEKQVSRNNRTIIQSITREYENAQPENPPELLGRNDEMGTMARALATELKRNLSGVNSGLCMEYQPKTRGDGTVFGAEALLRWRHPTFGGISPLAVLGVAEEAGLTVELGAWTLEESFRQLSAWHEAGWKLVLSVNLAPRQVKEDTQLFQRVEGIVRSHGLDTAFMELELTEQAAMDQSQATRRRMEQIKNLGIHISVDDFGMGSSSLLYLRDFYADVVKLDLSLVHTLENSRQSQEIVRSIVALCRQLESRIVAEGVETARQVELLQALGCDQFQGWYFSRSLSPGDFEEYLRCHGLGRAQEPGELPDTAGAVPAQTADKVEI